MRMSFLFLFCFGFLILCVYFRCVKKYVFPKIWTGIRAIGQNSEGMEY
jgi:hypothetical protein